MKITLDLQKVSEKYERPHRSQFRQWAQMLGQYLAAHPEHAHALAGRTSLSICVRLVEPEEMIRINGAYKHENKATTVLSFPVQLPKAFTTGNSDSSDDALLNLHKYNFIGDIVMCGAKVVEEAKARGIGIKQHWTHLYLHGLLHLLGFEHGEVMEAIETTLLLDLGIGSPYEENMQAQESVL